MIIQLPVTSDPAQDFVITLGTTRYEFYFRWNDRAGYWTMDVTDYNSQTRLLSGVPVLLGADLWRPFVMENGGMIAFDTSQGHKDASFDDFGTRVLLLWLSDDQIEEIANYVP